ncbi:MAG: TetR/AcrR family transcriptional regulator [Methylocystaceae bacterium]
MNKTHRQLQKEQTRNKLLEVALIEFGKRGIMATRMSDIAEAAGVSHGTVFAHFASQELLITAVIEETGKRMASRIHELAEEDGGIREVLAAHLTGIMEFETFYARLVIEARFLPPGARRTLVTIQSAISFHISQSAECGMNDGTITRMPIHLLFNTWIGLINYYLFNGDLFAPNGSVIKRYGNDLIDHYMTLIALEK